MPRIIAKPRYFSIPSTVLGAVALRNEALNWTPNVRSLTWVPIARTNSPAKIIAAWPRTVIRSRCPWALTRGTQQPFSWLWKVTRHDPRPKPGPVWPRARHRQDRFARAFGGGRRGAPASLDRGC